MNESALLVAATLSAGTPVALAALGLLINEKSGVLNLGAEGLMLIAAAVGFAAAFHSGQDWIGFCAGALAGAATAAVFGVFVIWLGTNAYASGLALTLLGSGLSAFAGASYVGKTLSARMLYGIPFLENLPWIGPALFSHHVMVYAAMVFAALITWFFWRTRAGLALRAVGESPETAHALGYPVRWMRWGAVTAGGALCGLSGAYLSIIYAPLWVEGMVAGRGWIALALTVFATWRPWRILLGAYVFGGVTMLQLYLQGQGVAVPSQIMNMAPYLATILVLVLISRNPLWIRVNMPASLGKTFRSGA